MSEIIMRDATLDDYDEVYPLLVQIWEETTKPKEQLVGVYRDVLAAEDEFARCAVMDGKIVGFAAGMLMNGFWHGGKSCFLSTMVADRNLRRKGIGSRLMDDVKEFALRHGCPSIELDSAFHRTPAHAFYEQYGFARSCYTFVLEL